MRLCSGDCHAVISCISVARRAGVGDLPGLIPRSILLIPQEQTRAEDEAGLKLIGRGFVGPLDHSEGTRE